MDGIRVSRFWEIGVNNGVIRAKAVRVRVRVRVRWVSRVSRVTRMVVWIVRARVF